MNVAIIGAGVLARTIASELESRGIRATCHSRSTGLDVTAAGDPPDLGPLTAVIEATNVTTQRAGVAKAFFAQSTRTSHTIARASGAKHILVSIVNCEKPALQAYGYYAGKAEQERIAREELDDVTIVRTTLWHEFTHQSLDRFSFGPFALVPSMTVQPIAVAAVAEVVAECVQGERPGPLIEVAGPEKTTLMDMTRAWPRRPLVLIPIRVPGLAGAAMRDGELLPGPDVERVGPAFAEWLAER